MSIKARLVGVGLMVASLGGAFFLVTPGAEEWIGITVSLVFGAGVCQAVSGLSRSEGVALVMRQLPARQALVPVIAYGVGLGVSSFLLSQYVTQLETSELRQHGVVTQAKVTEVYSLKKSRSGTTYHVKVTFKDATGQVREVDEKVDGNEFNAIDVSDTVDVIYLPKTPVVLDILADKADRDLYQKQPAA